MQPLSHNYPKGGFASGSEDASFQGSPTAWHGRWTGMVLPVAALALFVLCFLIGYGSVVQRRLEAGAEHEDSR